MTIDWWTLGLQAVNVLVLLWLLQRVLWRPIARAITARRAAAQSMIEDSQAKQAAAEAALAEIAETRAGFAAEREAILQAAKADAAAAAAAARSAAEAAASVVLAKARTEATRAADRAKQRQSDAGAALAVDIARRLVERVDAASLQTGFIRGLLAEAQRMTPAERAAAASGAEPLELVTAAAIDADARHDAGDDIRAALGGEPQIVFRTDPALIAGAELRGPHFILRNSWQADLSRVATELRNAD